MSKDEQNVGRPHCLHICTRGRAFVFAICNRTVASSESARGSLYNIMNKVDDKVLQRIIPFIDFSNIEKNKKQEYNKRDKFKNRKNWQDDKDILTQLTLLFYNNLEHKPTTLYHNLLWERDIAVHIWK